MERLAFLNLYIVFFVALACAAQTPPASNNYQVPLREGLTIVRTFRSPKGEDYESITRVTQLAASTVKLTFSTDEAPFGEGNPAAALMGDCAANSGQGKPRKTRTVVRTVQRQDLETAHEYRQGFYLCGSGEESYPGSTAVGVSAAVLRELSAKGQTPLKVAVANPAAAFGSLVKGLLGGASKAVDDASILSGVLTRVERGTLPFKVLVNDEEVELPAVHAQERFGDEVMEFWILNDPANPLILRVSATNGSQFLQVIKLSYPSSAVASSASGASSRPTDAATSRIERDLAERGRTTVYGIYFDFASDHLKPESNLVLAEIAHVLQKNPGWSLAVDGHTDNVGGDPYNLDLSKRRATAVKQALMTQYRIDGRRLQTNGYGASRPKDTNETVEGRSRNRRVELVKTS